MRRLIPILFIVLIVIVFFWQYFIKGLLPIPADTIIGLYHPFRDLYAKDYPNGIPFKNFLITDPVRQQYPWRELAISIEKKLQLPLWNPYNLSGTPLLANFQSAPFYLFNALFFIMPFVTGWSVVIFLGPLLAGFFLFLYLNNLRLNKWASVIGAMVFSFSGFFVAWMEWGTIVHVVLWLSLILLSIDKIFLYSSKIKKYYFWSFMFVFSLTSSFFAGHLQIFFYLFIFTWVYFFARWTQYRKKLNILFAFLIFNILFLILSLIQWIPTLQFISLSARNIDENGSNSPGWFIPWQHLIQFVAPDFFGNPKTLNYYGVWNYGELVGYVGIIPLILALFSLLFRRDKKTLFFGAFLFLSLTFSLPTFFAKIPYILKIPFLDSAQPTRLLFLTTFSLSVLSAFGFDYLARLKRKILIMYPLISISIIFALLWIFIPKPHLLVTRSNLLLPTLLFICSCVLFLGLVILQKKNRIVLIICIITVSVTAFDLLRFGWKFSPFTQKSYLFPSTQTLLYLQKNIGDFRIMSTDSRIFPPNFSAIYRLQSVDGYDPLYLLRYGELIAASERGKPDITPPFGFNRIITPHNYDSKIIDLLGVKYVLSLSELNSSKLKKTFQEGKTKVYENINVSPRAFFVSEIKYANDNKQVIRIMFEDSFAPSKIAIVEGLNRKLKDIKKLKVGKTNIVYYSENKVIIETENPETGFLVLTDSYYPTWHAFIDGRKIEIYRVDYHFRGIVVPSGKHLVEFSQTLL